MAEHLKLGKEFERTNAEGFFKNKNTKVIINTANDYYQKIIADRKHAKEKDELKNEINELTAKLSALEDLVKKALSDK
jgi:hypothetical protein